MSEEMDKILRLAGQGDASPMMQMKQMMKMVPTLTKDEVKHMMGGGEMTEEIMKKVKEHARMKMKQGMPAKRGAFP